MGELTNKLKAHAKRTYIPMIVAAAILVPAAREKAVSAMKIRKNRAQEG